MKKIKRIIKLGLRKIKTNFLVGTKVFFVCVYFKLFSFLYKKNVEEKVLNCNDSINLFCLGNIDFKEINDSYNGIKSLLLSSDINLANIINYKNEKDYKDFSSKYNIFNVVRNKAIIYKTNNIKLGVVYFLNHGKKTDSFVSETIKNISLLKAKNVDYIVLYLDNNLINAKKYKNQIKRVVEKFGNYGVDYIVGINKERIEKKESIKNVFGKYYNVIYSVGDFTSNKPSVILDFEIVKNKNKAMLLKEVFIPINSSKGKFYSLIKDDRTFEENEMLDELEKALLNIKTSERVLTIGEICSVLNVSLKNDLAYLNNKTIGKICSRSFEVNNNDVFFFRQQFMDNNDKEILTDEAKLKNIKRVMKRGCSFIFSYLKLDKKVPHITLLDTREAHVAVCSHIRKKLDVDTIAVTGSVGKTSTKDMLEKVISQKYVTEKSEKNCNVQVDIGLKLQELKNTTEVYIQEVGGGRPNGASRHSRMILPKFAVVTNIGDAHIGNFTCRENTAKHKLKIVDGMAHDGILFLNGDDELLRNAKVNKKTIWYAVNNHDATYYADNIVYKDEKTYFDIVTKETGEKESFMLNVLGEYNVLNAVCCYAIGINYGLTKEEIAKGLSEFRTSYVRQNVVEVAGYRFLMDCFNASTTSVDTSIGLLEQLQPLEGGKRIVLLGDITGTGELDEEIHTEIGRIVLEHNFDYLICFGTSAKIVYDMAVSNGIKCSYADNANDLIKIMKKLIKKEDITLLKGSSKMMLEEKLDIIFGSNFADERYLDERHFKTTKSKGVEYKTFENYSIAYRNFKNLLEVKIINKVNGKTTRNIADDFCGDDNSLKSITLTKKITHIGKNAFKDCKDLTTVLDSVGVKYINKNAFLGCVNLKNITFSEKLAHIESEAFKNCKSLKEIYVGNVSYIGNDAFLGTDVIFICKKNSYAYNYAKENNIKTKIID